MSITTAQIRGARGVLNWSQADLSQRTGISATSIGSIENGATTPRASTLDKIRSAFERDGIEFLGLEGMRLQSNYVRTLSGEDGFATFLEDVFLTAITNGTPQKPTEVFLSNVVHDNWVKWMGAEKWELHTRRMIEKKNLMDVRIIVKEGDTNFPASGYSRYKWFPEALFNDKSFYSYHDKLAFLNFKADDVQITIIQQAEFAEGYRNLFRVAWERVAIEPPLGVMSQVKTA